MTALICTAAPAGWPYLAHRTVADLDALAAVKIRPPHLRHADAGAIIADAARPAAPREWCPQCERRCLPNEAAACTSILCGLQVRSVA